MRLLNARTLTLEEFLGDNKPKYAILSHTWGNNEDEVTLQDAMGPRAVEKAGWAKIKYTCDQALKDGLKYAWVDTCCIDKASSTELSEAINSMFRWYEKAAVCYVYLVDVPPNADLHPENSLFGRSRWFTRGWTLQELLAPSNLIFFANDWSVIASRDELATIISSITGVDEYFLAGQGTGTSCTSLGLESSIELQRPRETTSMAEVPSAQKPGLSSRLNQASIAERMSWAAKRKTTRQEDEAYCLLGIFGVNMPLLYGEGPGAFIRLQEEIIRHSDDLTLLAWNWLQNGNLLKPKRTGYIPFCLNSLVSWEKLYRFHISGKPKTLLALSPSAFSECGNLMPCRIGQLSVSFSLTSKSLSIKLPVDGATCAILPCRLKHDPWTLVALPLNLLGGNVYVRSSHPPHLVSHWSWHWHRKVSIDILTLAHVDDNRFELSRDSFLLRDLPSYVELAEVYPPEGWIPTTKLILPSKPMDDWNFGDVATVALHLSELGVCQRVALIIQVQKLFSQGLWGFFPVWTTYRAIPLLPGETLMPLMERDLLPSPENMELGAGTLYAEVVQESVFGKPLFAIDIMRVSSGLGFNLFTAKQSWRAIRMRMARPFLDDRQHLRLPHFLQYWENMARFVAYGCLSAICWFVLLICWSLLDVLLGPLIRFSGFLFVMSLHVRMVAFYCFLMYSLKEWIFQRRLFRLIPNPQFLDHNRSLSLFVAFVAALYYAISYGNFLLIGWPSAEWGTPLVFFLSSLYWPSVQQIMGDG